MCITEIHTKRSEKRDGTVLGIIRMRRRRSQLEIYLDVLWTIKKGCKKPTRIMYGANLSWKPLKRILESMISQNLINEYMPKKNKDKRTNFCYELTNKGENVISYFNRAKDLIDIETIARIKY
jgi:predicted transcriptional regulator